MKPRIYIDTSAIGGYYDEEFEDATRPLFDRIANHDFEVYFSEINELELVLAPARVQAVKELMPTGSYKYLTLDEVKHWLKIM